MSFLQAHVPGTNEQSAVPEVRSVVTSGFVGWLLIQAAIATAELLIDHELSPLARACVLSILVVSFQAAHVTCFGAGYWLPLLFGAFELVRSPDPGAADLLLRFALLWVAVPALVSLLHIDRRVRALEGAYRLLQGWTLRVSRVDCLRPRARGWLCRHTSRLLECLRRHCALVLNRERGRGLRLLASEHARRTAAEM